MGGLGGVRSQPDARSCVHNMLTTLTAMPAVVVRQRKAWRRKDGVFLYFEASGLRSSIEDCA